MTERVIIFENVDYLKVPLSISQILEVIIPILIIICRTIK